MADRDLKVAITGDASGLMKALGDSSKATQTMAKEMEAAAGGLKNMLMGFAAPLAAFAALAGGKEFLKGTIEETKNWTMEAQKLARVLNITTEQASVLNLAIGDIYGTQEEYLTAVAKLTKTLNSNEEAFTRLGVATRDENGHLRDTPSIMAEVNSALANIKGGTDRNVASAQIYGKSWMEVQRYLKLTPEVMQAAQEKAEKLNLIVGSDAVTATNKYRESMNDLEDTIKGLKIRLGKELLPLLTEFNNLASDGGPKALGTLGVGLAIVTTQFRTFLLVIQQGWAFLKLSALEITNLVTTLANASAKVQSGDLAGAADELRKGKEAAKKGFEEFKTEISENAAATKKAIHDAWSGGPGDGNAGPQQERPENRLPKDAKEGPDPYDAFEATMRADAKARKERLALWDKHQADMYEIFGDGLDVQIKKLNDHYDEVLNRERDFGADEEVLERIEVERKVAIEQAKTDAAAKAAEERKRIAEEEAAEARRILEETGTAQQGFFDGMQQYLQKQGTTFQMWAQAVQQMLQGVTSAFAAGIAGILSGQMSLSQGMKTIWKGIVQSVIQAIAQLIAKWIVMTIVKKALGIEEAATDGGRTASALTTASAETWAAYAGIPFVGPGLAIAQIALMYASMGASMAASEGIGAGVAATARKVGGRVDGPEFTLLGEAGPEIVAPESDFRDYTRSILSLGANLGANLSAADAQVLGYGRAASGFASSRAGMDAGQLAPVMINVQGHILDTSQRGARQFGEMVVDGARAAVRERSVVLRTAEVFGGL